MKELELTRYDRVTGDHGNLLIDGVKDWEIEGNILYVLQSDGKRSAYFLSAGDSVEEL